MTEDHYLMALVKRIRGGDADAMRELVDKYGPELKAAIRYTMNRNRLSRLIAPSDILQTVLLRFFVALDGDKLSVENGHAFLRALINHRIADYARQHGALKRDFKRQVGDVEAAGVADPFPPPPQVLIFKEELEVFLRVLSPAERKIAEERMAGATWQQIAGPLGEHPGTIEKRFRRTLSLVANPLRGDADT